MYNKTDLISLRAEALFVSDLQPSDNPDARAARTAIVRAIRNTPHGHAGCALIMATEFGRNPDGASARMRWALALATTITPPAKARPVLVNA